MRKEIYLRPFNGLLPVAAFLTFFFLSPAVVHAKDRDQVIDKELNCINNALHQNPPVTWGDVCYTASVDPSQSRKDLINDALEIAAIKTPDTETKPVPKKSSAKKVVAARESSPADNVNSGSMMKKVKFDSDTADTTEFYQLRHDEPRKKFEFGPEIYDYTYTEYSDGDVFIQDKGTFYGVFANYTYRMSENQPIHSWQDLISDENKVNMFRLEGRLAIGMITYDGTGVWDGIQDTVGELRGIVGYDISLNRKTRITPFSGVGYRYLFDESSSIPAQIFEGQAYTSGYDRESNYVYIPLGVEIENKFSDGWNLQATGEYDFFIKGWQKSHFENSRTLAGANPGYETLKNDQTDGFGFRTSVRLTKETSKLDFFVEPFFRYWHIEDSEFQFRTQNGALICDGNLCFGGIEPDNITKELGVKLGIRY